ncbi:hypothetical protein [[Eubacterium] cellulosolvens]
MRKRKKAADGPIDNGEFPDIYNSKVREEMLEDDEISVAESGFMEGRELYDKKKSKSKLWLKSKYDHETKSTMQSQKEYEDD